MVARFDGRNPRAEQWLKDQSSSLVAEVLSATRRNVRELLHDGMTASRSPNSMALDIVGRVNRATKRREGGIIGLTRSHHKAVLNGYKQLRSGDAAAMRAFIRRKGVTRREADLIHGFIQNGNPVPADLARKLTGRYADNLLKLRGNTIARTELLGSLHHAQDEAFQQLFDDGKIKPEWVTDEWDAAEDTATRPSHAYLDGKGPDAHGIFTTGDGHRMRFPGDRSLNAPAEEIVNCRCRKRRSIDFTRELAE